MLYFAGPLTLHVVEGLLVIAFLEEGVMVGWRKLGGGSGVFLGGVGVGGVR